MKKIFFVTGCFLFLMGSAFCQESEGEVDVGIAVETFVEDVGGLDDVASGDELIGVNSEGAPVVDVEVSEVEEETIEASHGGYAEVPAPKRPKPIDSEKAAAAAEKDESEKDAEKFSKTIKYGIPSEISDLLTELIKNEDPRFTEEIYDVFQVTKNSTIKEKIITYFTKLEDPCLEDFAVDLLNDPYDETKDVVKATFQYVSAVKTTAAAPAVLALIESENEKFFNDAIATIGDIGGPKEAMFLVEYLERDDLTDAQRQTLMRTCGKMHAVQTWDKLVDILDNDDENTYVRMYAAEAIGLMKVDKSIPVLTRHFSDADPNFRQYVIKGLVNFPENEEVRQTILQGVRDEHWKVRQESIKAVTEMDMKDAVPYLTYRAKNDTEKVIKDESFSSIAKLNTQEGNDFLVEQITDRKVGDATKKKVIEVLLKEGNAGESEILELATKCATDDKRKDLRYAIGKELAKYSKPSYAEVCMLYLQSKDTTTQSLGLDMYKNCRFNSVEDRLHELYDDKKTNGNLKKRIGNMLKIEDEDNL